MLVSLLGFLWRSFPMGPQFWRPHEESRREHALIVVALEDRDAEAVTSLMHQHVVGSLEPIRHSLSHDTTDTRRH